MKLKDQTYQPVQIPVGRIFVHGSVGIQGRLLERRHGAMFHAPRRDESPSVPRLRIHVTVHREALASIVVDFVHATALFSFAQVIKTGLRSERRGILVGDGSGATGTLRAARARE